MNEVLFQYLPDSNDRLYLWAGLVVAVVSFFLAYRILKRPASGRKHTSNALIAMLLFFLGMMAMGTSFFSGWSLQKQGKVSLYQDVVQIGKNKIPYQDIRKIYLKQDKSGSLLPTQGGSQSTVYLIIEERDGQIHALSEIHYPVGEIVSRIKTITAKND